MRRVRSLLLTVGACLGSLCLVLALAGVLFGVKPLVFRSGSMGPDIPTGALALARPVPAADLAVGDVVSVVNAAGVRVTHRVAAIDGAGDTRMLTLRGDANPVADSEAYPVTSADRVFFSVPWVGRAVSWLGSPIGLLVLGGACVGVLVLGFTGGGTGRRRGGRRRTDRPRGGRRRAAALAGPVVAATLAVHAGTGTLASWSDTAAVRGATVEGGVLAPPTNVQCTGGGLLQRPIISWTAPTTGPATGRYLLLLREGSPTATPTSYYLSGTSWQVPASLLELLATYYITVESASVSGTSWTSQNYATPGITVTSTTVILGVLTSCGTFTVSQPAWS